jgi:hypothetical protein
VLLAASLPAQEPRTTPRRTADISFGDAKATFELLDESWPAELRGLPEAVRESSWPGWVRKRDAEIRARIERGDEDSLVNLWLYGTTFTNVPPARSVETTGPGSAGETRRGRTEGSALLSRRLEDLLDGISAPGQSERLTFARALFERRGMSPITPEGRERVRRFLVEAGQRALREHEGYERTIRSAQQSGQQGEALAVHSTLFRDRGLSSDTSILIGFAIWRGLEGMMTTGTLRGPVRHVGIVGPGLDFADKADGHDFYPLQSLQPFAIVDALLRLGLADPAELRVTTFDVNPRVNDHLERARLRASRGEGYPLHAPLSRAEAWRPEFLRFWNEFGNRIADPMPAAARAGDADSSSVRAVRVRPAYVASIQPMDVNIVVERPSAPGPDDRLDLIIATNVLVYYDRFEQSLAVTNAAAMLRPGGVLLTNNAVLPVPPLKSAAHHLFVNYSPGLSEHVFWYQRE